MPNENTAIKEALRRIFDERGTGMLKKQNQLCSMLKDYAPDQSRDIKLIANALREGIGEMLLKAVSQSEEEQQRCITRGKRALVDNLYISEEASCLAVETIAFALGIDTAESSQAAPQPVSQLTSPPSENMQEPSALEEIVDAEAAFGEGLRYLAGDGVGQDYALAAQWFQKAAEQGYAQAQDSLGSCYAYGEGVEQDYDQAAYWYWKAAEQGDILGEYHFGCCYFNGNGIRKNCFQAVKWFQKAAEKGLAAAQVDLGDCYANGDGAEQDYTQAVQWYQKAAEQGDEWGEYYLGYCYFNGKGVQQDHVQAVYWYRKAAEQGCSWGQYALGVCYEHGLGIEKDHHQAMQWYVEAAKQGCGPAQEKLNQYPAESSTLAQMDRKVSIKNICDKFISEHDENKFKVSRALLANLDVSAEEAVYLAHDDTIFHTGKHGFVITDQGIHLRDMGSPPVFISYAQLAGTTNIRKENMAYVYADSYKVIYFCGEEKTQKDLVSLIQEIRDLVAGL